jgi:hypothetical protein
VKEAKGHSKKVNKKKKKEQEKKKNSCIVAQVNVEYIS